MGRQRRDRHPLGSGRQQGPARGHRVGARADRGGDHQAVAGEARVEGAVDRDRHDQLAGAGADHGEIVDGHVAVPYGRHVQPRHGHRLPVALADHLERGGHVVGVDRGQHADAPAGDPEHRPRRLGPGVERRQRRAVAAERDDDLAGLGAGRVRDLPRLPRDHDLAHLDVVRLRPAAHLLEHAVEIARGMDDEA